ncbi:MAG: hypothetical protein JWN48_3960 [Myxococcaceae bacterium]|nr:hypothetical protein [Myxococcaceae bacterium]
MSCPNDETRLAALLGELSVNEARALERHCESCTLCTAALRADEQLLGDLAAWPALADREHSFTAKVMAACTASAPSIDVGGRRRRTVAVWSSSLALSACAAAWLLLGTPRVDERADTQARGAAATDRPAVAADVLFVRDAVLHPLSGAQLRDGDALAVRYTNVGDTAKYLAVFMLDAQRELHWIYPAYVDARDNPRSVALTAGVRGKLLDEVVAPEQPAAGPLQVFTVVTSAPLHVQDVEALGGAQIDAERLETQFVGAAVQTWRATWNRD